MVNFKVELTINFEFFEKLKKARTECSNVSKELFGDDALSRTHVFEYSKRFCVGQEEVEDDELRGRPVTARN